MLRQAQHERTTGAGAGVRGQVEGGQLKVEGGPGGAATGAAARTPFALRFWWITLARGLLILALGVGLLFGENTRSNVATFFGVYWLLTGALAIRWALSPKRERIPPLIMIAGVAGLVTGVVVLARTLFVSFVSAGFTVHLIGFTALLVGALHIARGFSTEPLLARRWGWDSFLLGVFEVVLGVSLLAGAAGSHWMIDVISAWAIGGGVILILDAAQLRRAARKGAAAPVASG
jgi:uncharacterized membrane protein HdeD (DUF308 family)